MTTTRLRHTASLGVCVCILAVLLTAAACEARRPEGSPGSALVTFVRSGGLAGVDERLVIEPDGQAMVTTRRRPEPSRFVLGPDELARLRSVLDEARLSSLHRSYRAEGADMFQYDVTYRDRSVTADDSSIPKRLRPAIQILAQLTSEHGGL